MPYVVGIPGAMLMTARHFANRAPSLAYSWRRSRRPSSPSVTSSPGAFARSFEPVSTLMPGGRRGREELRDRRAGHALTDRLVVEDHAADVLLPAGRREERAAEADAVLFRVLDADALEALPIVLVLSSAARMPFPARRSRARSRRASACPSESL